MIAGTADIVFTRSSRIHPARPTGSMRSMQTTHAPIWSVLTGPRTMRLRMVSGSTTPRRTSGNGWCASATAPTSRRLCWLCTTPLGRPVVPLVYTIAAGANGSTSGSGAAAGSTAANRSAHALAGIARLGVERRPAVRGARHGPLDLGGRGAVTDEHRHAGVVEQVALLGERERTVDADPHAAEVHGREERHHQLGVVGHAPGDAISRADAPHRSTSQRPAGPGRRGPGT